MPTTATSTTDLSDLIKSELDELIAIRHDLHAHPELCYNEHRTSELIQRELKAAGVDFVNNLAGGTGVLGYIPGAFDKATGLRADIDALPIQEQTGLDYASTTSGKMHACGHDGHTTILIGAARVLAKLAANEELPRPITFCFQPAEEGGAGGKRMVEDGCLDGSVIGPPIEHMFGLHGWPMYPLGVIGTRPGPLLAASDRIEITIRGRGSHAAFPQMSCDPVVASAAIVSGLQTICSRNVDPLDSIVISITQINGGTAHNIIPGEVKLAGTVRTLLPETQQRAQERIDQLCTSIAKGFGCEAGVVYEVGYPVTFNDSHAVDIFNTVARDSLGDDRVRPVAQPVMGGEDFSFYCQEIPSCFFVLGLIPPGEQTMPQLHQPTFDFNDDALATGIEMFCRLALRK